MATTFKFKAIHVTPPVLGEETLFAPTYDVRQLVAAALRRDAAAVIALRLDVEGGEFHLLDSLTSSGDICRISYLFVEFHNLHVNLSHYGLPEDAYYRFGARVHEQMDTPGCRLQIYWRNFWSACGDPARYMWMKSEQATGLTPEEQRAAASAKAKAKENKRMLLSKVYKHGRKKKHRRLA